MNFKANIDPIQRGFYFAVTGNDDEDGLSIERPKATIAAAEAETAFLIPSVSAIEPASVIAAQGGRYTDPIVLVDFVLFNGRDITLNTDTSISVDFANFLSFEITTTTNEQNNSIVYNLDTVVAAGVRSLFAENTGDNGVVINIDGVCDNIFVDVSQISVAGTSGTGIVYTGTSPSAVDFELNLVSLAAINTTFIEFDPVNSSDEGTLSVSSVENGNTGTTGFLVKNGLLAASCNLLTAITAIKVESGGTLNITCQEMAGAIIVDSGGILHCDITDYIGTITNNGTINGNINGVDFGTYIDVPANVEVLRAFSMSTQNPSGTDNPLKIEFGAAQGSGSDPVQISSSGDITINEDRQYNFVATFQYARTAAGGVSFLFSRVLLNGVQKGNSILVKLDNANVNMPAQLEFTGDLVATDVVTFEIFRDSVGNDSGGLFTDTPTLVSWDDSPSATIVVSRGILVKPS